MHSAFSKGSIFSPRRSDRQVGLDRNHSLPGAETENRKLARGRHVADPPSGDNRAAHPVMNWFHWALASAFFAGLTAILAKIEIEQVDSNVAMALRTTVVVCLAWTVAYFSGFATGASQLNGRAVFFLVLSGLATGASWLCYFRALQLGDASQVAPVDKLSTVFVLLFAALFLGEKMRWQTLLGAALIVGGVAILGWRGARKLRPNRLAGRSKAFCLRICLRRCKNSCERATNRMACLKKLSACFGQSRYSTLASV